MTTFGYCYACERDVRDPGGRTCVIDGCHEPIVVHVEGFPDCVDRCLAHDYELRPWDEPWDVRLTVEKTS